MLRASLNRLRRLVTRESRRRRAARDIEGETARTMGAMVLRTLGTDAGPLKGASLRQAERAFADRPSLHDGIARLTEFLRGRGRKRK